MCYIFYSNYFCVPQWLPLWLFYSSGTNCVKQKLLHFTCILLLLLKLTNPAICWSSSCIGCSWIAVSGFLQDEACCNVSRGYKRLSYPSFYQQPKQSNQAIYLSRSLRIFDVVISTHLSELKSLEDFPPFLLLCG